MASKNGWSWLRVAALAATLFLAFGSVAWGQSWGPYNADDHYYRHDEAREHGYRNGVRDGLRAGQYDTDHGRHFNFKNDDWEDSRDFEHWMGSKGNYKSAYRVGFERGYRRGYGYDYDRYHDRDDWR
jgi:hypothetical protein